LVSDPCPYLQPAYLARAGLELEDWTTPQFRDVGTKDQLYVTCQTEAVDGDNVTLIFRDCDIDDAAATFRGNGRARELQGLDAVEDIEHPGFVYASRGDWCLGLEVILFGSVESGSYDATASSAAAEGLLRQILADVG
jgi:hypothetical protein